MNAGFYVTCLEISGPSVFQARRKCEILGVFSHHITAGNSAALLGLSAHVKWSRTPSLQLGKFG